jgi:superfamily II DNA/RNA helicase
MEGEEVVEKSWEKFKLHPEMQAALLRNGFAKPTEIQHRMVYYHDYPVDMVGVSQTGSGKTLAYLVPLLNNLYNMVDGVAEEEPVEQEEVEEDAALEE